MSSVIFVTGSSRGLGRRIVEHALQTGHRVVAVATARNARDLDSLMSTHGDAVCVLPLDVTDAAAAVREVREAVATFGRIDVVVNNAGQGDRASLEDVDLTVFRRQIDTNFLGTVYVSKAVVPVMRAQGGGRIIQISSIGGRIGTPGMTAYHAAKWAVGGFSEALATEVESFGIKITVLEPGGMRTQWAGSSMTTPPISVPYDQTVGAAQRAMVDFHRTAQGDPDKVADLVLQLAAMDDPPLRLLAGSDSYQTGRAAWQHRLDVDALWESLSATTDHDAAVTR